MAKTLKTLMFGCVYFLLTNPSFAEVPNNLANPYGIGALWREGDTIIKATLLILLIMSVVTWYVVVVRFIEQSHYLKLGQNLFAKNGDENPQSFWAKLSTITNRKKFKNLYAEILVNAQKSSAEVSANPNLDCESWIANSLYGAQERINASLQNGMATLATIGSTAPFVGLFGTVWSIYHALIAIGMSGQASIDKVAGPIGEALIMTAVGLAVAVPSVLGHNWLLRRNQIITDQAKNICEQLHAELVIQTLTAQK